MYRFHKKLRSVFPKDPVVCRVCFFIDDTDINSAPECTAFIAYAAKAGGCVANATSAGKIIY